MSEENSVKSQVEEAVGRFVGDYLKVTPKSVSTDIHAADIVVTLQGIVPPAEKDFAESAPEKRALLEECYSKAFETTKGEVERMLEDILGRAVESSMLHIDPRSGNAVMVFNLADESSRLPQ